MRTLENKKIAILVTDGFEEIELTSPKQALEESGATVDIISPKSGKVKAWATDNWGGEYDVDKTLDNSDVSAYDGLLLPGGVMNPDQLRMNTKAISFIKDFFGQGKPIAAICHAPQLLIETGALEGRELTSYPSLATDLKNAGAHWVDKEVIVDHGLVTSRSPEDLKAFNSKMLEEFAEGVHEEQNTL